MSNLVTIIMCVWKISDVLSLFALLFGIFSLFFSLRANRAFSEKRYLKEITIEDIKGLREDYRIFLNRLISNQCDPRFIVSWFKVMNLKMEGIGSFIKSEYKKELFKACQDKHNELKRYVTGCADMNNSYNQKAIIFTDTIKNEIIEFHNGLYRSLLVAISDINRK